MPPLTATPKPLDPVVLTPNASDAWLKKVFGPRERSMDGVNLDARKSVSANDREDNEGHSYREELMKYIAESTANLSAGDAEPLDDLDEDSSDEPCSDIFDCDSDAEDDYVEPPVEVPRSYRAQDLKGGMLVGGACVLFTNWAFKRQLHRRRCLPPIPERRDAGEYELPSNEEGRAKGVYSGKIVEL
ncbi:hypothetical protein JG687_00008836 [Phytophthora cactorum]|uniref:Uncharacterized protein n=1 Tax=Phytophthora cactorum TaxID=29920 RepID=A0A329SAG0_9STRA|nr:hypothetical protein Pcac1_g19914 [Phytophthora cactorum]KAG2808170.1 hypothetical protein PC112_g17080 [Phytophthora cactorum]KAG2809609.1 hypothetical protein PC111_g15991 [Phytophthora cactorum]KAG2849976.1 hypothetical protein PC113_g17207 [Phytophthora cactorum]KAG2887762.1 hypothetical protein PC114_g18685 [Phytophthora cactorum]